jgi:ribosomal protein L11 methyltransferase
MPRSYVELQVAGSPELFDRVIGLLSELGFEGFWEDEDCLRCYMARQRWQDEMMPEIRSMLGLLVRSSATESPKISLHELPERNWNQEWEKSIAPIRVTNSIVIAPTWHRYDAAPGELLLRIDPKMAFGTGYHESTRLILRMLQKHLRPGDAVLDIGTGTGVLAIAAIKLGACNAIGLDVDEWAYANAIENVRLNRVEERVQIIHGDHRAVPRGSFDMITANIQRNVIEEILPELSFRLSPGGRILLSGLLREDREQVQGAAQEAALNMTDESAENEWLALAFTSAKTA